MPARSLDHPVTMLVPSLANSLAEQFNVFRVMHHGTHEKQLSNVFAWLLTADGTHQLGDAFQRLFAEKVNGRLPPERRLPASGYRIAQEVDTGGAGSTEKDIADIELTHDDARIVVENFEWSDGWENAVVLTYAEVLESLQAHIAGDRAWRRAHTRQKFFIDELVDHYVEGPRAVSTEDQIRFLTAMCDTGESARYGHRPQETAAEEFADLLALHAKRQFEEGRKTLSAVKRSLRQFARGRLAHQLDGTRAGPIITVQTPFVGQWEWAVALRRAGPQPDLFLEFGPTAVVENGRVRTPLPHPDYSKVFVTRQTPDPSDGIDLIRQTDVGLDDVLNGLSSDDVRLRDAVLAVTKPGISM